MPEQMKAKLRVVLYAGETEVAESLDVELWQSTLAKMHGHTSPVRDSGGSGSGEQNRVGQDSLPPAENGDNGPITKWASAMSVSVEAVEGACSPSKEPPFLQLNAHNWESLKRNTPSRGTKGVSQVKLAATLLALWQYYAKTDTPSITTAQAVLKTINLYDTRANRGLDAAEWLRRSGEGFVINPAKLSQALAIAAAYVSEEPIKSAK